jgi:hypothetical protein
MQATTRYGLAGMGGLALLTAVHQVRAQQPSLPPAGDYLVGVLPNFAAAIAISFVLLSAWSDQNRTADHAATRRAFRICMTISGVGLIAWELFQIGPNRLVFDPHDIGATLVGLGVSALLFSALTPRSSPENTTASGS